jgi:hypothetical protein
LSAVSITLIPERTACSTEATYASSSGAVGSRRYVPIPIDETVVWSGATRK